MQLEAPYAMFLGDLTEDVLIKTAHGVVEWTDRAACEVVLPDCSVSTGLPRLVFSEPFGTDFVGRLTGFGVKTLIVGIVPPRGVLEPHWFDCIETCMSAGINVACGTHDRLTNYPRLVEAARLNEVELIDFRHDERKFPIGNGRRRGGKRLLTIGQDCAVGKKYTAMCIHREMLDMGIDADFRPTGQTGRLFVDESNPRTRWIVNDTIVADFLSGAAEYLSPDNRPDHWDVIEGQASIWHPFYGGCGVQSLLFGSQPDALVLCVDPTREFHVGTNTPLASIAMEVDINSKLAARTNPDTRGVVALSVNLSRVAPDRVEEIMVCYETMVDGTGMTVFNPNDRPAVRQLIRSLVNG